MVEKRVDPLNATVKKINEFNDVTELSNLANVLRRNYYTDYKDSMSHELIITDVI